MEVPVRSTPRWFGSLTLRGVAALSHVPVDQLLHHRCAYGLASPSIEADGTIRAVLQRPGHPEGTAVLRPSRDGAARFEHSCTCREWGFCTHVVALLADLAISDGLRDALARGGDVRAELEQLPRWRATVHRAWTAERIASAWLPVEPVSPGAPPEYHLMLPAGEDTWRALQSHVMGFDGKPALDLRVRLQGQRAFLDSNSLRAVSFAPEDQRVLRLFDARSNNKKTLRATGTEAALALHLLRERPSDRLFLGDGAPLEFAASPLSLHIVRTRLMRGVLTLSLTREDAVGHALQGVGASRVWDERGEGAEETDALEARWRTADGAVDVSARRTVLYRGPYSFLWVAEEEKFFPMGVEVDPEAAWALQVSPAVEFIAEHAESLWKGLRRRLRGRSVSLPSASELGLDERVPGFVLSVDGMPLALTARVEGHYAHALVAISPARLAEADADERRDLDLESAALAAVSASGFRWEASRELFVAQDDDAARFWRSGVQALRSQRDPVMTVMIPASLGRVTVREAITARLRLSLTGTILDLALAIDTHGYVVDLKTVREALAKKRRWVMLDDGALAEITDTVADLLDDTGDVWEEGEDGGARAKLPLHQLGRVERWMESVESTRDASARALREKLRALAVAPDAETPEGFAGTLRPYQRQGLAWMQFLDGLGAGGVLADDMGLGKTVMTLAWMLENSLKQGRRPSLVVCPTSVAGNWVSEAKRFAPTLRVVSLAGIGAEARAKIDLASVDLVVTTYALLRRDVETLRLVSFRAVVLDEAQNIKNVDATTTRAARALRAELRLALTGTPVENRLTELWSIMDFANPGMLGSRRSFEVRFEKVLAASAMAGERSPKAREAAVVSARLRALVRPFVLRRTRAEVLDDLPPRQEIDLLCPLSSMHRRLYDALAYVLREEVKEFARRDPFGRPGIAMFTALLRLRQMACDPRMLDATSAVEGAKRAVFLSTVKELVAEGRRALVFSQFTELLGLWGSDLSREGIAYEYLDGSTTERDAVIRRFQEGVAPLFLISLKAGGAGLNLTAADTVIHCDPWWNPAVEEQATARAHRIGQTRGVTVYRLVARGTVEDRVITMKDRKRTLADAVIGAGHDTSALAGVTADEIATLLANADGEGDGEG